MPENMDVTKMKVADLKRELKLRGLSITGNKMELAERLQASDFSFEDTTISGEDLLEDEDAVLTDEEKILDENELLKSPGGGTIDKTNIKDLFESNEDVSSTIGSTTPAAIAKKVVLKRKISCNMSLTTNDVSTTNAAKENTSSKVIKMNESNSADETKEKANTDDSSATAAAIKQVTKLTAQERLELRAKKFGITSATNPAAAADKNAVVENESAAKNVPATINSEKEAELLKKRAERFGCVVSSKMVQLDAAERLQKRKERFGGAATTTKVTVSANSTEPAGTSDVWAEKARLRLERFKTNKSGSTTTESTTINATN